MSNKIIVYVSIPVSTGVYRNRKEKIYPADTAYRVVKFDGNTFELKKLGKGCHCTVSVSAQFVYFFIPSYGYVEYIDIKPYGILKALGV